MYYQYKATQYNNVKVNLCNSQLDKLKSAAIMQKKCSRCRNTWKEVVGSGTATLIISNEQIKNAMQIVKFLEEFVLLTKVFSETVESKSKEEKDGFLSTLLGT